MTLAQCGRIDEAIAELREAIKLKPDYAEAHHNLGVVLAGRGQADEAIAQYEQALAAARLCRRTKQLGCRLGARGQLDAAILHFRRALEIQPNFPAARRNLDLALSAQQRAAGGAVHP